MSDPIAEIIGDYRAFAAMQRDRLVARGIDIAPYPLSHLAVRVADWDLYVHQRTLLERHARANRESVWNGRPISLIVLAEPLEVLDGTPVSRIELIPPVHQRVYRMGLEHLGVVVGEEIEEFSRVHRAALTGQQFQSPDVEPVYVLFEDFTHVKFYRRSFFDVVEDEEGRFEGFSHVDDWVRSGWSPPPARIRSRGNRSCSVRRRGYKTARCVSVLPLDPASQVLPLLGSHAEDSRLGQRSGMFPEIAL
jgi:predicted metalloenzyme YecM